MLRAVATVGVVVIHSSAWASGRAYGSVQLVARFSVPTFMVLTGLLLAYQYRGRPLGLEFARLRLLRTIVPWVAWIPVYVVLDLTVFHMIKPTWSSLAQFVSEGGGHLWYLLLIPQFYVLFALWPRRGTAIAAALALALQTALALVHVFGPLQPGYQQTAVLQYGFLLFPFWIGYFGIGVAMGRLWRPLPAPLRLAAMLAGPCLIGLAAWLLLTITFAGAQWQTFLSGTGGFLDPLLPLLVLSITGWLIAVAPPLLRRSRLLDRGVRSLGELSLPVYIIHPIPQYFLGRWLYHHLVGTSPAALLFFCAFVLLTLLAGLILARLVVATPLAITVGLRRRGYVVAERSST